MPLSSRRRLAAGGFLLLAGLAASPARADVIDGHWCFTDGRQFTIRGPDIVTSRGLHTQGDYTRHSFAYKEGDWAIAMTLVNEMTIHLRRRQGAAAGQDGPYEVWRRCQAPISRLDAGAGGRA